MLRKPQGGRACRCPRAPGAAALQGPEHCNTQGERHGEREGDVEVLAHVMIGLTALGAERKQMLSPGVFTVKWKEAQDQGLGGSDKGQGSDR